MIYIKIILAPDSFKGSISAKSVCDAIELGISEVFPNAAVYKFPLADGGEGIIESLVYSTRGEVREVEVKDPLGRKVLAKVGILGNNKTAVIEIAQASGLPLLDENEKDPLIASSFGTGELIKYALDHEFKEIIIGLGGSATNDAGVGMLKALGIKFYNAKDSELIEGGEALLNLAYYDDSNLDPRLKKIKIIIASDVTNPLCGPDGASHVFGPQKGASSQQIDKLERALNNYNEIVLKQKNFNMQQITGGGAAGGMGASLVAFLDAEMESGIDIVMETVKFENEIEGADLIITGEGKLDKQTLHGKVISGVSRVAKRFNVPVIVLCGKNELNHVEIDKLGVLGAFSIVPGPATLETSILKSNEWLKNQTIQIMKLIEGTKYGGSINEA